MIAASLAAVLLLCAAGPEIEVVADGPLQVPRGEPLISNDAYEVTLGALLEAGIRTGADAAFTVPLARLRAEAVVEKQIPAGMRLEIEASPFAEAASNLNGPGALRDAYVFIGVGNKKVLDLGEIRVGQLRVPSSGHSLRPPERWRFSHRPLVEARLLPGRDLGFVYHIDYGSHGVPVRLWIGNFTGAGPNDPGAEFSPLVSTRAEVDLLGRPQDQLRLRSGVGFVFNSGRPEQPAVLTGDLSARARRFSFEAAWALTGPGLDRLHERAGLRAEVGVEPLSDFLELRLRHEALNLLSGQLEQRTSAAAVVTYLDDAFQVLFDLTIPSRRTATTRGSAAVLTFRLWW